MKVRQGFVSNSSTSSFVCSICDETYSGWDASPCDDGGGYCEYEHIICGTCMGSITEELGDIVVTKNGCEHEFDREANKFCAECGEPAVIEEEEEWDDYVPSSYCPICKFEIYDSYEMGLYLEKLHGVSRDEVFAKVKEKNRRRRKLYDEEYVSYVLEQINSTDDDILEEIRTKFKTFNAYYKFIHDKD